MSINKNGMDYTSRTSGYIGDLAHKIRDYCFSVALSHDLLKMLALNPKGILRTTF